MNATTKQSIDALGTTGILLLIVAVIALGLTLWAPAAVAVIAGVIFAPLLILAGVFLAAWLAVGAIVAQLAER